MNFESWRSYWNFASKVKRTSRFIHDDSVNDFLQQLLATSSKREKNIKAGSVFWRSQIGHEWRPIYNEGEIISEEPCPYPPERMNPSLEFASEGRANPRGILYLYLSTNKETAMSEVRPWIGTRISVGQFRVNRDLRIIDCSGDRTEGMIIHIGGEPSKKKREKSVWSHIYLAFSEPVTANEFEIEYVPTQIIAEFFKHNGFDGIVYNSALSEGFNLVLFDLEAAKLVNCFLYDAKAIKFDFEESANPYFKDNSGGNT